MDLSKIYLEKIGHIVYCVTSPEIEMLMVHALGLFAEFNKNKSSEKPSTFIKKHLKSKNVKTENFIKDFYSNYSLVDALKEYKAKAQSNPKILTIADLLRG